MRKLIWRVRYALYMKSITKCQWHFAWDMSGIATDDPFPPDWREWSPSDSVDEEMSYWGD